MPEEPRPPASLHVAVCAVLVAAAVLPFALTSLHGAFVYDDARQIVANPLIQDERLLGRALTSDVWAFKGDRGEAWSNYWRPGFVLWLILNRRLFGLQDTVGWHAASLALHAAVTLLAYAVLCRLGLSWRLAAAVALLFAVHPVHVESVAWISGAPDPLAAVFLLAALWCVLLALPGGRAPWWGAAILLHAAAVLVKEVAVVFPVVVAVVAAVHGARGEGGRRALRVAAAAAPFAAVSALYLAARFMVLGFTQVPTPWRMGLPGVLVNAPQLLLFYLRQSVWPLSLGPSYPLRAVRPGALDAARFAFPLALAAVLLAAALLRARRSTVAALGLALFVLLLLPAFNIDAFIPEQLTHDRYLYLAFLGVLMVIVPRPRAARAETAVLVAAAALALPLAVMTARYAADWTSEVRLWSRGVRSDPGSSFNWAQYGHALLQSGDLGGARTAVDRALTIGPVTSGFLTRAEIAMRQGRSADAAADLLKVLADQPDNALAYDRLAASYLAQGRPAEAEATLRKGREWVPYRRCSFGSNIAAVLYQSGRKAEALAELEEIRPLVAGEPSGPCRMALVRLGHLYAEAGRGAEAARAFEDYLRISAPFDDPETRAMRRSVESGLAGAR